MKTYSEIVLMFKDKLDEMGLGEIPSLYLRGNPDAVYQDGEVTDRLKAAVLESEVNGRRLLKLEMEKEAERSKVAIERNREDIVKMKIEQAIHNVFPPEKIREEFKMLYDGFLIGTIAEMRKHVIMSEDQELILKGTAEENPHPENMNPLERLLYNARVSRYTKTGENEKIEDLLYDVVKQHGSHQFFKR